MSPANNYFGHGFYQLSPEFYYRALGEENGFSLESMLLFEDVPDPHWYEVPDPRAAQRRITFTNARPTSLALLARRVSVQEPLAVAPEESDYADLWADPTISIADRTGPLGVARFAPRLLRRVLAFQDELRSRRRMRSLGLRTVELEKRTGRPYS
jgi:hypothetical protein